jgi:MFS family permease
MKYLEFLIQNARFLAFGIAAIFFASSGQTFFISIFGGEFRREFGLTNGDFGFIYMIATIASAFSLIALGRLIDRIDLRLYTALICGAMTGAIFFISSTKTVLILGLSFYFLRLMGQGLMVHIAITSMGRYFFKRRGTAISIITFGDTLGLTIYPLIGVALIGWIGWRDSWLTLGFIYLIALIPLMLWLLKGQSERHKNYEVRLQETSKLKGPTSTHYSIRLILKELRFYLMIPAILAPSFLMTGLIFHQVKIVEIKGWSMLIFTNGFIGLATASFLTSLLLGPLIDRWRAINFLPFILLPLSLGLLILNIFDADYIGFIYLICLGGSLGATFTVAEAIWPELYGTTHLGAIKSFTGALTVFSSALAPWVFGLLFDMGIGIHEISWLGISTIILTGILAKLSQLTSLRRLHKFN